MIFIPSVYIKKTDCAKRPNTIHVNITILFRFVTLYSMFFSFYGNCQSIKCVVWRLCFNKKKTNYNGITDELHINIRIKCINSSSVYGTFNMTSVGYIHVLCERRSGWLTYFYDHLRCADNTWKRVTSAGLKDNKNSNAIERKWLLVFYMKLFLTYIEKYLKPLDTLVR